MSLGADRIVGYVADALTKSQVEMLLWPDLTPGLTAQGKSKVELIQEEADKIWAGFLLESGVDERGSQDQILEALLPSDWKSVIKQHVNAMIKNNISDRPAPLAAFSRAI